MSNPAKDFRQWMIDKEVSTKDACKRFGISKQTLYNWRSSGVPEGKQAHVNYVISCWSNPTAAEIGSALLLKPTAAQFREWNLAALEHRQLLEEWAIDGLDKYAGEMEQEKEKLSLVAAPETPYRTDGNGSESGKA
jgi:hypothetical protein